MPSFTEKLTAFTGKVKRTGPVGGGSPTGRRRPTRNVSETRAPGHARANAASDPEVDQLLSDVREYLNKKLSRFEPHFIILAHLMLRPPLLFLSYIRTLRSLWSSVAVPPRKTNQVMGCLLKSQISSCLT